MPKRIKTPTIIQLLADKGGELTSPPILEFSFDMTRETKEILHMV